MNNFENQKKFNGILYQNIQLHFKAAKKHPFLEAILIKEFGEDYIHNDVFKTKVGKLSYPKILSFLKKYIIEKKLEEKFKNIIHAPKFEKSKSEKSEIPLNNCPICLELIKSEINMTLIICGHIFHKNCLEQWQAQGKRNCPICRQFIVPIIFSRH